MARRPDKQRRGHLASMRRRCNRDDGTNNGAADTMPAAYRRLIAGNWKMNCSKADGLALTRDIGAELGDAGALAAIVAVCPPFTLLHLVAEALGGREIKLGAQDCHNQNGGAFTGSIAAAMLADAGCTYVILGHSERRHGSGESDVLVRAKIGAAWEAKLIPILCVGETQDERAQGTTLDVVGRQLAGSLPPGEAPVVVAYEPVWAIGSGRVPSGGDIAAVHTFLRQELTRARTDGDAIAILYGGSATTENAAGILGIEEVGGLLVGGASLNPKSFAAIARAAG